MAIQNDNTLVTKGDLKSLYTDKIAPYLGGGISYYYTDRTGQELKSCFAKLESNWTASSNTNLPLIAKSGNIIQLNAGLFTIPSGTRIEMIYSSSAHPMGDTIFEFYNNTDSEVISDLIYIDPYAEGGQSGYLNSQVLSVQWTNNTNHSVDIAVRCRRASGGTILLADLTSLTIKEIGRIVDPVKYVDNNSDLEETPVGNIISYMGNSVPKHYLACDGQTYPIGSYPELEAFIINEFGSINYFGGDGSTTWAVPDLRGEFLRGTGTNSHTNQGSGAAVGVHQDGTEHSNGYQYGNTQGFYLYGNTGTYNARTIKEDSVTKEETHYSFVNCSKNTQTGGAAAFTSRPTNTSVKYCIKYESTYHAFFSNAAYKVSIAASVAASSAVQLTFDSSDIIGDSSLISGNSLVAPMDGWYSLGMNWSQSGSGDIGYYIRINGASGKGYNRGIFISDTLYLNKGDVITIWKESGSANSGRVNFCLLTSNYNPTIVSADSVYSENEQMIGYWKDGKPLYQKTIVHNVPTCITNGTYVDDYVLLGTDKDFLSIKSTSFQSQVDKTKTISSQFYATNDDFRIKTYFWRKESQNALIISNACEAYNDYKAYITIQYTKTIDTASTLQIENSLLNRPDLWEDGVEYHFGGGLYGARFAGTVSASVAAGSNVWTQIINRGIGLSSAPKMMNFGGWIEFVSDGQKSTTPVNSCRIWQLQTSVYFAVGGSFRAQVISGVNGSTPSTMSISADGKYDIWVTYKK